MHSSLDQIHWHTPMIPLFKRLLKEDQKYQASLGYIARPLLEKQNQGLEI